MNEFARFAVLAIDGGGTQCRIAYEAAGNVTRANTGPANAHSDFDGAVFQISQGLTGLSESLGIEREDLLALPTYAGLAGVSSTSVAQKLQDRLPFSKLQVGDDRKPALRGALGQADGAIIHCGTGSFFGLQRAGETRLAGGWGSILGDEASAHWIGWSVLSRALRVSDGTLPESALARAILADLGGIQAVLDFASDANPTQFGALAPRVTKAATEGDPFAQEIMRDGAKHIVDAIRALGWTEGMDLCLTGGVAHCYLNYLPETLARSARPPLGEPLDGALALAREVANDCH